MGYTHSSSNAPDHEIQQTLIDISIEHGLTQVHDQPTRQENIIDLAFTDNPSLVKHSQSILGISDHAVVVTDSKVKPIYNKQKQRKIDLFSKANWEEIYKAYDFLSNEIIQMVHNKLKVESIWEKFKAGIQSAIHSYIPSKNFKKKTSVHWFNEKLKRTKRKGHLYRQLIKSKQWTEFKKY